MSIPALPIVAIKAAEAAIQPELQKAAQNIFSLKNWKALSTGQKWGVGLMALGVIGGFALIYCCSKEMNSIFETVKPAA